MDLHPKGLSPQRTQSRMEVEYLQKIFLAPPRLGVAAVALDLDFSFHLLRGCFWCCFPLSSSVSSVVKSFCFYFVMKRCSPAPTTNAPAPLPLLPPKPDKTHHLHPPARSTPAQSSLH